MRKTIIFCSVTMLAMLASAQQVPQEQARVISATPVIQQVAIPQQVCSNETIYSNNQPTGAGAVLGALAGGAAGNTIGNGGGRAAATAVGIIGGALLGNQVESNAHPAQQNVQRCTTETRYENRTIGYDVVYEYAGRRYTTRTPTDPGPTIPVVVQPVVTTPASPPPASYTTPQQQAPTYPPASTPPGTYTPAPLSYYYQPWVPVYALMPAVSLQLGYANIHSASHWRRH
ncbi:glycine zipper 2TM domain-containing protein [Extensimonas vulgaris]|uniref:Uncharacterized protein YcfJ n=1 Tax=Extensimonas vulgaris TaxID=1031594 RepID=A0A369AJG8_9BURK|nr:glycine zipper 2TM domain-containing protein [Extensimonas vulgaris]RCX09549.1 uncharacterized protein YcfJ [Extensimonas vulgaris]TWI38679.1 uncharacterized protein YcfJ [Extensimonas vulgaris]TXD14476.1 glycine zipper 2TM domain-containing protein [Extensimonas vulgaris]